MSRWLVECAETVKLHTLYERVSNLDFISSGSPSEYITWATPPTTLPVVHFTSRRLQVHEPTTR